MHTCRFLAFSLMLISVYCASAREIRTDQPRISADATVAQEHDGNIIVEAEDFFRQTRIDKRAWHITDSGLLPSVGRDIDPPHFATASGGAYIEVLPDEGNDGTPPIKGLSISDVPGEMAVVEYRVNFANAGRYYIWSRAFGTDGDDNTLHYGLDGTWPDSSARSHTFGGKRWRWANRHRKHKGRIYFDVPTSGVHIVAIAMREDGCELDQFVMTTTASYTPPPDSPVTAPRYHEAGGMLVVEAESLASTESAAGWKFHADTSGHTGRGFLSWSMPHQARPAGEGVLVWRFRIVTAGDYQLHWRSRLPDPTTRPETLDPDGNDTWVRFSGGIDIPAQPALGEEWNKVAILGHPSGWSWSTHADRGPPHPDAPVCRRFTSGDYLLEFSGRSHGHAIDRIVLRRIDGEPISRLSLAIETRLAGAPESLYR